MGLYIQSLENIPPDAKRDYYIYLLDYGWAEPLGEALVNNYEQMAAIAAEHEAVVIRGTRRVHFEDEVLSWHHINGEDAQALLPAILITNRNPHRFKESHNADTSPKAESDLKLVLIPLKSFCITTTEVAALIQKLFGDIKAGKQLSDFRIVKERRKGASNALADAIILGPNRNGKGSVSVDTIKAYFQPVSPSPVQPAIEKTVHPIHFEDRSGREFERLVFAYLFSQKKWDTIEWLGQPGSDGGRDIWGIFNGQSYCYQCANYQKLALKKVTDDIDKLFKAGTIPDYFVVVCGGTVTATMRENIKAYAAKKGIGPTEVWSGVEFEERLRHHTPELIKRFVHGDAFPELDNIATKNNERGEAALFDLSPGATKAATPRQYFGAPPQLQFKGRVDELKMLQDAFARYNTFQIGGISGIGKTSFIARFLDGQKPFKVLWVDCDVTQTQEDFFLQLGGFVRQELENIELGNAFSTTIDTAKQAMISALQEHSVCVVFDALNSESHPLLGLINALNKHLTHSKVLFSTTQELETFEWANPVLKVTLSGIDVESFRELLTVYGVSEMLPDDTMRLYHLLNGHPYLLKLACSVLHFQESSSFIEALGKAPNGKIAAYIKTRLFEQLSKEEITFLGFVSVLHIPFRYKLKDFVLTDIFDSVFEDVQKKFLVERFHTDFYIVPEFIKTYVLSRHKHDSLKEIYKISVGYLSAIKSDARIFEREALVYYALNADLTETARTEAMNFLSALMAMGGFNRARLTASALEKDKQAKKWDFVYYVQARVLRFQEDYEGALAMQEKLIMLFPKSKLYENARFEKASLLVYQFQATKDPKLLEQANTIYTELSGSGNPEMSVQSKAVIANVLIRKGKYNQAIKRLETIIRSSSFKSISSRIVASIWQSLGDANSLAKNHNRAIECYHYSLRLCQGLIDEFGMNVIDAIYYLYQSLATTYANAGDPHEAAAASSRAVQLCAQYNLQAKFRKSLFDLGYHLVLAGDYANACRTLYDYYTLLVEEKLFSEANMRKVYATLVFAHWYDNQFLEAVELLGLYVIECVGNNYRPVISVMERDGMTGEMDVLKFFHQGALTLIIPTQKTFKDFYGWLAAVEERKPELSEALNGFMEFRKPLDVD